MINSSALFSASSERDGIYFLVSVFMVALYHLYLRTRIKGDPNYTIQSVNRQARALWVKRIMSNPQDSILGVQTLRNSTMAATLMASTSVLLVMGTLTLADKGDKISATWHALNMGDTGSELLLGKLLMILLDFFFAFFSFSLSVRMFNHVGYLISVISTESGNTITPEQVALYLNNAGKFYSMGMRAFYFSVPLVFWLFGPQFLLFSSMALIVVLYKIDRAPSIE